MTLILHKSHIELHCGRVPRISRHSPTPLWPASLPSLAAFICCPSNLQWNVPCHETSSLLSTLLCAPAFTFCRPPIILFFPNSQRPRSEFCEGNYCKIPLQERASPVGILLCGVMHKSGLCGGGQPCPFTDQKQIEETEKPQCLPCSPEQRFWQCCLSTSVIICLTTLRLWARLVRCNDTDSYMIQQ